MTKRLRIIISTLLVAALTLLCFSLVLGFQKTEPINSANKIATVNYSSNGEEDLNMPVLIYGDDSSPYAYGTSTKGFLYNRVNFKVTVTAIDNEGNNDICKVKFTADRGDVSLKCWVESYDRDFKSLQTTATFLCKGPEITIPFGISGTHQIIIRYRFVVDNDTSSYVEVRFYK